MVIKVGTTLDKTIIIKSSGIVANLSKGIAGEIKLTNIGSFIPITIVVIHNTVEITNKIIEVIKAPVTFFLVNNLILNKINIIKMIKGKGKVR